MQLFWARATKQDFQRLHDFLDSKNRSAAIRAAQTIRKKAMILLDNPELGLSLGDEAGQREYKIPFGKGAYILRYVPDYEAQQIRIVRIWHSREERDRP